MWDEKGRACSIYGEMRKGTKWETKMKETT
jgi:hypothetical protein